MSQHVRKPLKSVERGNKRSKHKDALGVMIDNTLKSLELYKCG